MEKPFSAYRGHDPYVFICYAHRDSTVVYTDLVSLKERGVNVWYDEGIPGGTSWRAEIAESLRRSRRLLFFISPRSLTSEHCMKEVRFALDESIDIVPIFLEDCKLPAEFALALGGVQAIYRDSDILYAQHLEAAAKGKLAGESSAGRRRREKKSFITPFALALTLLVLGGIAALYFKPGSGEIGEASQAAAESSQVDQASIAVMPFTNFSDDKDMGYFGDGLAEEILNLLANLRELNVSARTSSFYFKDRTVDIPTIARHLGVRHVLEGSVRFDGDRVRVTAQLIDAEKGFHIWSDSYDRDMSNIFTLQDEIAGEVVKKLEIVLSSSSKGVLARKVSLDPDAYDRYLRGRDYLRQPHDDETLSRAELMFQRALEIAPDYADAYAGLCDTLLLWYQVDMDASRFAASEDACLQAQTLDSRAPTVHVALGNLYRGSGQYALAEREFNEAISLNTSGVDAYVGLSQTFAAAGKLALAEQTLVRAIELQPNNWSVSMAMGKYLVNIGRVEEAISYFERIDSLLPESGAAANNLGSAFFLTGRFEDAAEAWEQAIARTPTVDIYANLGASYFFLQRFDEAAAMYRKGLNLAPKHFEMWGNYGDALMAAGAPDDERARVYLRAYELAEENLRINPSDAITLSLIGHYLARLGRDEEALKNVKLALELAQKDIYVYYFSAITLSTLNELDRAQQAADEALALGYPQFMLDADIGLQPLREQLRSKQNTVR